MIFSLLTPMASFTAYLAMGASYNVTFLQRKSAKLMVCCLLAPRTFMVIKRCNPAIFTVGAGYDYCATSSKQRMNGLANVIEKGQLRRHIER